MVSAVIDDVDHFQSDITNTIEVVPESPRLQLISGTDDWPEYNDFPLLKKINEENTYRAISNHCSDYFMKYFDIDNLIFIDDSDPVINAWTLARAIFPDVHRPTEIRLRDRYVLHDTIKSYGKKVIHMNDIMNGNLITVLKKWIDTPLNEQLYTTWLERQQVYNYPFPQ